MADFIRSRITHTNITVGVICGSGFDGIVDLVQNPEVIRYKEVPGLPVSTGNMH